VVVGIFGDVLTLKGLFPAVPLAPIPRSDIRWRHE
jgi:hypothetical protein